MLCSAGAANVFVKNIYNIYIYSVFVWRVSAFQRCYSRTLLIFVLRRNNKRFTRRKKQCFFFVIFPSAVRLQNERQQRQANDKSKPDMV